MANRSTRKRGGGCKYMAGGKKRGATKKHHRKANKTRRGRKGSKKHAKRRTHRRKHRGGNLVQQLTGSFAPVVAGPLQEVLGDDASRTKLKLDAKKLRASEVAVGANTLQGYKGAKNAAASIVNKAGSGNAVAVLQQLANSQPQVRNAFSNHSLIRP